MKLLIKKLLREGLLPEEFNSSNTRYYHGSPYPELVWGATPDEEIGWASEGYGIYLTPDINQAKGYAVKNGDGYLFTLELVNNLNIIDFEGPIPKNILDRVTKIPDFYKFFKYDIMDDIINAVNNGEWGFFMGDFQYTWDKIGDEVEGWARDEGIEPNTIFIFKEDTNEMVAKNLKTNDEIIDYFRSINTITNKEKIELEDISKYDYGWGEITYDGVTNNFKELYFYMVAHFNSLKKATMFFVKLGVDGVYTSSWSPDDGYFINLFKANKLNVLNKQLIRNNGKYSIN